MANRIKGITVEIDGSTTGLDKALKDVNSTIKNTQTQLKDVQRLLKLDPSNTELLSQKQRLLKEAIGATKDKLESLKTARDRKEAGAGWRQDGWCRKDDDHPCDRSDRGPWRSGCENHGGFRCADE